MKAFLEEGRVKSRMKCMIVAEEAKHRLGVCESDGEHSIAVRIGACI